MENFKYFSTKSPFYLLTGKYLREELNHTRTVLKTTSGHQPLTVVTAFMIVRKFSPPNQHGSVMYLYFFAFLDKWNKGF